MRSMFFALIFLCSTVQAFAQSDCSSILEHGVRDQFNRTTGTDLVSSARNSFCSSRSMTEEIASAAAADVSLFDFFDAGRSQSGSFYKSIWSNMCSDRSASSSMEHFDVISSAIINKSIVSAWSDCVASARGFVQQAIPSEVETGAFNYSLSYNANSHGSQGIASVTFQNASCTGSGYHSVSELREIKVSDGAPINLSCSAQDTGPVRVIASGSPEANNLGTIEFYVPELSDWVGNWTTKTSLVNDYSTSFVQEGAVVTGTYSGMLNGKPVSGKILGIVDGRVLTGRFARNETDGNGPVQFFMAKDGNSFSGTIYTGRSNESFWNGTKRN